MNVDTHAAGMNSSNVKTRFPLWRAVLAWFAWPLLLVLAGSAVAQTWNEEQQEVWKIEELQWKMSKDKDHSWMEKMVHPNMTFWENGQPVPQNKASLHRWNRYLSTTAEVLEQELYPLSIVITGNIAVVQYHYQQARENLKKEREMVFGRYTDILIKEGNRWLFLAWSGGDDPKK